MRRESGERGSWLSYVNSLEVVSHVAGHLLHLRVVELLDVFEHANVVVSDEVDRHTLTSETTRTTNSAQVIQNEECRDE